MPVNKLLRTDQVAYMVGVSKVTISEWVKVWALPAREKRGFFDANIFLRLYVENVIIPKYAKPDIEGESVEEAKRRKEIAVANLKELQASELKGELVPKDEAIEWVGSLVDEARNSFVALPRRMAPTIYGKEIRDIENDLRKEINRILTVMSRPLKDKKPSRGTKPLRDKKK